MKKLWFIIPIVTIFSLIIRLHNLLFLVLWPTGYKDLEGTNFRIGEMSDLYRPMLVNKLNNEGVVIDVKLVYWNDDFVIAETTNNKYTILKIEPQRSIGYICLYSDLDEEQFQNVSDPLKLNISQMNTADNSIPFISRLKTFYERHDY